MAVGTPLARSLTCGQVPQEHRLVATCTKGLQSMQSIPLGGESACTSSQANWAAHVEGLNGVDTGEGDELNIQTSIAVSHGALGKCLQAKLLAAQLT
jgi:hypothetical protein